jgi:hypothetical protein
MLGLREKLINNISAGVSMLSTANLARLGMLVFAAQLSIVYAHGRKRGAPTLARFIQGFIAVYALAHILFMVFLWVNHIAFPLNLEAMELTVLQHLKRVIDGLPLYAEPSPEFVALAYNPLYYYLTIPFVWLFGVNLFTLRLVAILGMLGSGLVIFLAVRRNTSSNWWALMAVGLFAAAYRVMDTYLDNAHADSWLLFTVLLGCYLIDLKRSQITNLIGVLLMVSAFWFKQHGALFAIGAVLNLTWQEGWRKSWPYWVLAMALGPVLYLAAPAWLFGPGFHYFTGEVPRRWSVFGLGTFGRLADFTVKFFLVLATIGFFASASALLRSGRRVNIWYVMFPVAVLSGFMGALDPGGNNNVLIPMGTWFIITGVMGLKRLFDKFEMVERRGLYLLALGVSFALLVYNPLSVVVSPQAAAAYQDMVGYLESLNGPVYAPWIGQLQDSHQFYPSVHWVALIDMIRGPGKHTDNHTNTRKLLEPVLNPKGEAYILMNYPLEGDVLLDFLTMQYVLDTDLGERFAPLATLPRRYNLGWPRYLYRYAPEEAAAQAVDGAEIAGDE